MKGKFSWKTILVLIILVLTGVLGVLGVNTVRTYMGGAAAGYEPKNVVAVPGEKSIKITWTSEKQGLAYVEYGTSPAALLLKTKEESSPVSSHEVVIDSFKPNTTYYFRIRAGEEVGNKNEWEVFDNAGIPYSFKSKGEGAVLPTPTISPPTVVPSPAVRGACDHQTDYNKDGVVNSLDYLECSKNSEAKGCQRGVDYDKNGTINSLDLLDCLQKGKR